MVTQCWIGFNVGKVKGPTSPKFIMNGWDKPSKYGWAIVALPALVLIYIYICMCIYINICIYIYNIRQKIWVMGTS